VESWAEWTDRWSEGQGCSVALLYGKYSVWRAGYSGLTGGVRGEGESERGSRERTGTKKKELKPSQSMVIHNKIKLKGRAASLSNCTYYKTLLYPTTWNNPVG